MGAWIESHTNLIKHHKVLRMANELNIRPVEVIGHLHCLWHNVLEFREDGDITAWTSKEIAFYSEYDGNTDKFFDALLNNGWIDKNKDNILIHDWLDYAGKYLQAKYRTSNEVHLKAIKEKHSHTVRSPHQPNQPNLTNQPNHNIKISKIIKERFDIFWAKYPRQLYKKATMPVFFEKIRDDKDWGNVQTALTNYNKSKDVEDGTIMNAYNWLESYEDWIDYREPKKKSNKLKVEDL